MTTPSVGSLFRDPLLQGYAFALVTVLLWASFVVLGRLAGSHHLNPYDLTALRFAVAALALLPFWLLRYRFPLWSPRLLLLAVLGGAGYALCAYVGLSLAPAAHGAVLLSGILPFFMALVAWLLLGEVPTSSRWRALALIALGVLCLLLYGWDSLRSSWRGDLMLMLASALWALYTVLVKRWNYAPLQITMAVALLAALLYLPVYVLWLPKAIYHASLQAIVAQGFFHGILVVIVAMWLFMQAMVRLGPTRLGAVMAVVPALAGLGAVVILGEAFSWWLLAGLAFTSAGAWLGARSG